jgi:hypothetical protein
MVWLPNDAGADTTFCYWHSLAPLLLLQVTAAAEWRASAEASLARSAAEIAAARADAAEAQELALTWQDRQAAVLAERWESEGSIAVVSPLCSQNECIRLLA